MEIEEYKILLSIQSEDDIQNLSDVITYEYDSPNTAFKYIQGIINVIKSLSKNPERHAIRRNRSLLQYGMNVRRVDYKKMAILYTINGDTVYIHRVIAGSMITGL